MLKDMVKNKRNIVIILLIIGIIGIGLGLSFVLSSDKPKQPNNNINNNGNGSASNNNNTEKIGSFSVSNLEVDLTEVNVVKMFFKLENTSSKDISNKPLDVNFYDNDDKLIFTYSYLIESLKSKENIYVQGTPTFPYQNIKKYEFVIDNNKVIVEPTSLK